MEQSCRREEGRVASVSFRSDDAHGPVTALSEAIRVQCFDGGRSSPRYIVLVGALSRILVCDVCDPPPRLVNKRGSVLAAYTVMPHGCTVHGIVVRKAQLDSMYHVVAYGARYVVAIALHVGQSTQSGVSLEVNAVRAFDKWVLAVDVQQLTDENLYMAVGMIDNSVEICCVSENGCRTVYARRQGTSQCMLYSMDIVGFIVEKDVENNGVVYDVRVAGGTVLFDVVVWRLEVPLGKVDRTGYPGIPMANNGSAAPIKSSTVYQGGHTGSVHCVCWEAGGNLVASGSDDRTVRIWMAPWFISTGLRENESYKTGNESSPVFRHKGRIWSLRFSRQGDMVFSGTEDGCVTCWDLGGSSGSSIAKWNSGKGVRVIRLVERLLVTGGAEGSVRVWDVDGGVGRTEDALLVLRPCFANAISGDNCGILGNADGLSGTTMTRSALIQALSEMKTALSSSFEAIKAMCFIDYGRQLVVASDKGRLSVVSVAERVDAAPPARELYSTGSSSRPLVNIKRFYMGHIIFFACCDALGALHLLWWDKLEENLAARVLNEERRMIDSFVIRHGQRLMLICYTASENLDLYEVGKKATVNCLATGASPLGCRVTAAAWVAHRSSSPSPRRPGSLISTIIVIGSAKGGLAAYKLMDGDDRALPSSVSFSLLACHKRGHGQTPVQTIAIHPISSSKFSIETTAMDFCIQKYTLDVEAGTLARNNEVRLDAIKTICSVAAGTASRRKRRLVVGFFSTRCIVWDRYLDALVCEFPSAGWKRPWALDIGDHEDGEGAETRGITFCYTSGVGDIQVFRRQLENLPPYEIVAGSHGREINSVVDVGNPETQESWLVTAGADARLYAGKWFDSTLNAHCISTQPFGTSTRVLKMLAVTPTTRMVVSGGARSILTAWRVVSDVGVREDPNHHFTNNYRIEYHSTFANPAVRDRDTLMSKATMDAVDMRVTALGLVIDDGKNEHGHPHVPGIALVAIALSTGELELRRIPRTPTHRKLNEWPLVANMATSYPVLSMVCIGFTVWAGATNGDLIAWNTLNGSFETYPAIHASGINAMAFVDDSRAIITGGDDQSISVFCVDSGEQRCVVPNAHASAVKDLCAVPALGRSGHDDTLVCSIGLDQYLRVWNVSQDLLALTSQGSTLLQVQEPVACCFSGRSTIETSEVASATAAVTVVGRGIERIIVQQC